MTGTTNYKTTLNTFVGSSKAYGLDVKNRIQNWQSIQNQKNKRTIHNQYKIKKKYYKNVWEWTLLL